VRDRARQAVFALRAVEPFLVLAPRALAWFRPRRGADLSAAAPSISVIVPVRDDATGIARTLDDLQRQTLPVERYEVLIVDNGSRDRTLQTAREKAAAGPARVRVLTEHEIATSYAARNRGIAAADGDLLCFIDADMGVPAGHLASVLGEIDDRGLDYAGCRVEIEVTRPTVAACHNRLTGFPVEGYLADGWAPTCCLTVRHDVVQRVGAFDADLSSGGDAEFGRRVAAAGYRQGLLTSSRLLHPARTSLGSLTRKTVRTASGKARLARTDPHHAGVVRAYASWHRLRPLDPRWVRREMAQAGLPDDLRRVAGVVLLKSWLDAVRLATAWWAGRRHA
jgi:glycosyltransferase AglI